MNVWNLPPVAFKEPHSGAVPQVMAYLYEAADRGGELHHWDVLTRAQTGQMLVLVATTEDGVVVGAAGAEVNDYPRARVLSVVLLGGTQIHTWLEPLVKTLDDGCRKLGVQRIEMVGRPGWARALKPFADEIAVLMVREVDPDERRQDSHQDGQQAERDPAGLAACYGRDPEPSDARPERVGEQAP